MFDPVGSFERFFEVSFGGSLDVKIEQLEWSYEVVRSGVFFGF